MNLLTIHYGIGFAVVALALFAVWQLPWRRVTLYALTLQIVVGVVLTVQGVKVPWHHYALAVIAWIGYMAANGIARRSPKARNVLLISGVSSLLVLLAFYVGMHAVKAGYAG
ncbi:MAG: hypothetical protein NVS3B7_03760 [Candidatus Elarobacter sp.]